ncbi:MAG TPA: ABC transporter permease [Candidatus Lokiarchaeia archaeon]|nr:ABC transporter permease [Candidatus Lokiarchaeia archaeon]
MEETTQPKTPVKKDRAKRMWGLVVKELRLLLKDKFAMLIIFFLPIFLVIVIQPPWQSSGSSGGSSGGMISTQSSEIPTIGYINLDHSAGLPYNLSEGIVSIMHEYNNQGIAVFVEGSSVTELEEWLGKGTINAYIVLPDGLEYNVSMHFPGFFTVKFDTINTLILPNAEAVISQLQADAKQRYNLTGVFNEKITNVGLPDKAQTLFLVAPIFFPMTIFAIAALTCAQSIVGDVPKTRLLMTPANKFEIVTSKLIANEFMIMAQGGILVGMSYGMGLETIGSPILLFGILAFIGLAGICLGLAISAVVNTPLAALQLFIFVFLFQMIILLFLQGSVILNIFPMHNGYQLTLNQIMRGENFWDSGILPFLYVAIWIGTFYVLTLLIFYRKKEML